jgi:aspartate racemase
LGLIGTRFTMQGPFYRQALERMDVTLTIPTEVEQDYIHDIYLNQLVHGVFRQETSVAVLSIIKDLKAKQGIDGLILGGTELPLLLRGEEVPGVPFLDTTKLHVERIVTEILSD